MRRGVRNEGKSRRASVRNQQVVVLLQEREGRSEKHRGRGRAVQSAESRLPLKGKHPHSQHTTANDKYWRG